ncbi:MAG TPA: DNA polymerase III subunit gamma/tau [Candidatus Sulfotelmatobacter sp.]|jgi:DNA polymerase-3 subunit gamma/tau|nr:DNA polymerase III subunit gamma/tau [Candidatus Sulfotelmatobacter sp.]
MVFYRKYRPQTIDDLDSKAVRDTLHAVLQKAIPHAFLFTGPKGLGKTSTARIIAKAVNCENQKKGLVEPCNACDQCISITNGTNVDILEIDAASNRGIDEIRDLKEKIRLAPVSATKKVYIIDEVHMLTTEAFNALLKTLEEPPEHAMFMLCTTEAHKVPETIVSRCFQITFKKATDEEILRALKRIVISEKLQIADEALVVIAKMADGGFRDATKILEEVSLFAYGEGITKTFLEKSFKITKIPLQIENLLEVLKNGKAKAGLELIKELTLEGIDLKFFITQVLVALHIQLLIKMGVETGKDISGFGVNEIRALVVLFSQAYQEMKYAVLPQLPLELAVIEWCEETKSAVIPTVSVDTSLQKSIIAEDTEVSVISLRKQVGTIKKLKALYGTAKQDVTDENRDTIETTSVELLQTAGDGTVTKEWMELFWQNLISEMKKYNHTVAGVLRGCTIKSFNKQHLLIQTTYKFHKERLDDMKNRDALLKISKLLTGKDIEITVELKDKK